MPRIRFSASLRVFDQNAHNSLSPARSSAQVEKSVPISDKPASLSGFMGYSHRPLSPQCFNASGLPPNSALLKINEKAGNIIWYFYTINAPLSCSTIIQHYISNQDKKLKIIDICACVAGNDGLLQRNQARKYPMVFE